MRGVNVVLCAAAFLLPAALVQQAEAQVTIQIGTPPPSCPWGYYNYAPYRCAPRGYWGSNYFYNGIFLGVGPWGGWGYNHGWGNHRFGGTVYHGARPDVYGRAVRHDNGHGGPPHNNGGHGSPSHNSSHGNSGHGGPPNNSSHGGDSHGNSGHGDSHNNGH